MFTQKASTANLLNTALVLSALIFPLCAKAELPNQVLFGGIVDIAVPPYGWTDSCTRQTTGASRHLVETSLSNLGIDSTFQPPVAIVNFDWNKVLDDLLAEKFDLTFGLFPASLDDIIVQGKQPVTIISSGAVHHTDNNFTFNTIDDLKNKKGVIYSQDQYFLGLESFKEMGLDIHVVDSLEQAMKQVISKQADFMVSGRYRSRIQSREMGVENQLKYSELDAFMRYSYIAAKKGTPMEKVIPLIDKQLKIQTENGYREHLRQTYLLNWYRRKSCDVAK